MLCMKKIVLLLSLVSLAVASRAQMAADELDSVMVRENRLSTPYAKQNRNLQILDRKAVQTLPVKSTAELLSYLGGVDLRQRGPWGSQGDVSLDGSTFDQVLVLVNGVKMSDPQTGHHLLNLPIPLSSIERVEVLHGPAARVYGVNALAGAINIVTRIPDHNEVSGQVYSGSSFTKDTSNGDLFLGWGAQAAGTIVAKNTSHTLSIAHDQGNGYRYNTGYDATRAWYQNSIRISDKDRIEAMGGYIHNKFGASLFYAAPGDKESEETVQSAAGSVAFTHQERKWRITPRLSYRYNKDDYIYIRQKPEVYHNIHETNVLTAELNSSYQFRHGTAGAGVEWRKEDIRSNSLGKRDRDNLGLYAEYKHYFSDKLNAGAGVYANHNSDFGWQVFPGADVGYSFLPGWKAFANAGTGQRLPTYNDLYYKGPVNIGNDQLQPELASYAEAGLQYRSRIFSAQLSYGYRHISDFIDWTRLSAAAPWQPHNFQDVNTQVTSFRADYELSRHLSWSSDYQLSLHGSYTYLNPAVETPSESLSKYAVEALRHQGIATARALLWQQVQLSVSARYQQRINVNDYTLMDARVGYQWKQFLFYADANNIFDKQYREISTVPLPGRWVAAGVRFNYR